jgi:hypothetical protein
MNPHDATIQFEKALCAYTGAPYCVTVDNCSNALSMCIAYLKIKDTEMVIPSNTYPSVPAEIILSGNKVRFNTEHEALRYPNKQETEYLQKYFIENGIDLKRLKTTRYLTGEYPLAPLPIWDSALRFTSDMYRLGQYQCISFTGQWKILKTLKGGAILTDNYNAYLWFKRFRFSGRHECSYHADTFDMIGKNYYLHPIFSTIGLQMLQGFYNLDGSRIPHDDLSLPYPDLSNYQIYKDDKN